MQRFPQTFNKSGISSLDVKSPISFVPTVSGRAEVITYVFIFLKKKKKSDL